MTLKQWKDRLAIETYSKKWDELTINQRLYLRATHKEQFAYLNNNRASLPNESERE